MTITEVDDLFKQTLIGDDSEDAAWKAVTALQRNGCREVFERAAAWLKSEDPKRRARAADILAQLVWHDDRNRQSEPVFRDESFQLIASLLQSEDQLNVLDSGLHALAHLGNPLSIPLILRHVNNSDSDVRMAATFALGKFPDDSNSVQALLLLAADPCPSIRDWAVFALGVLGDSDSPEIRTVLLRAIDDGDKDVRLEAICGLGKRQDPSVIPSLLKLLDRESFLDMRVRDAALSLLELSECPEDWQISDYKDALIAKFPDLTTS